MDPNIVGRAIHGYSSALSDQSRKPTIRRLFVRELTPETHGNGIGMEIRFHNDAAGQLDRLRGDRDNALTSLRSECEDSDSFQD